jgi:hypothetical protein
MHPDRRQVVRRDAQVVQPPLDLRPLVDRQAMWWPARPSGFTRMLVPHRVQATLQFLGLVMMAALMELLDFSAHGFDILSVLHRRTVHVA